MSVANVRIIYSFLLLFANRNSLYSRNLQMHNCVTDEKENE